MIFDKVENLSLYKGINKNLDAAIEYLEKTDYKKLADGRHPVLGTDTVYAQVSHYETKNLADGKYEAHKKYYDIQLIVEGQEACHCLPLGELQEDGPFIEERDIGFYKGQNKGYLSLEAGMFAIFFFEDAHMTSIDYEGKKSKNHKILVKILAK